MSNDKELEVLPDLEYLVGFKDEYKGTELLNPSFLRLANQRQPSGKSTLGTVLSISNMAIEFIDRIQALMEERPNPSLFHITPSLFK